MHTTNDAETASICDCCCESWSSSYVHASQHDRMIDFKEVSDRSANLLWLIVSMRLCIQRSRHRTWRSHYEKKPSVAEITDSRTTERGMDIEVMRE